VSGAKASATARLPRALPRLARGEQIRLAVILVLLAFVLAALPSMLSLYWVSVATAVAIYAVVALGLGLLMGRVGLVSLGQIAVLALGSWVAARLSFATSLPFPLVLLATGLITGVLGTLVGLPALRLSGLYLALITLMLAGAINVALATTNFPNGGGAFLGHTESSFGSADVRRPSLAGSDPAYFRYTVIVCVLMFALALWHIRSKPGRAWAAIRQSEPAALAAGVNMTLYKLWAFGLASFMTGVAGGLLAGDVGKLFSIQFTTVQSITLLAVVLMGGIYSLWGAILAGVLFKLLPALLDNWGLPADLLTILFGVGVLQVLLTAPAGLVDQFPKDMAKLGRLILRLVGRRSGRPGTAEGA
jgi:branched-chain amino acid transport system permease protein